MAVNYFLSYTMDGHRTGRVIAADGDLAVTLHAAACDMAPATDDFLNPFDPQYPAQWREVQRNAERTRTDAREHLRNVLVYPNAARDVMVQPLTSMDVEAEVDGPEGSTRTDFLYLDHLSDETIATILAGGADGRRAVAKACGHMNGACLPIYRVNDYTVTHVYRAPGAELVPGDDAHVRVAMILDDSAPDLDLHLAVPDDLDGHSFAFEEAVADYARCLFTESRRVDVEEVTVLD